MEEEVLPRLGDGGVWRGETVGLRADGSTFREDHSLATTHSGGLICVVRSLAEASEDPVPAADE